MTRIDFYLKASEKVDVIRKLASKAFLTNKYVYIHSRNQVLINELDGFLWLMPLLSFLPHVKSDHPLSGKSPILIGSDPDVLCRPDVLINYAPEIPGCFSRFERVLEIVSDDSNDINIARERFRYYKERGYELNVHDLSVL